MSEIKTLSEKEYQEIIPEEYRSYISREELQEIISANDLELLPKKRFQDNLNDLIIMLKGKREKLIGYRVRKSLHPILLNVMHKIRDYDLRPINMAAEKNQEIMKALSSRGAVIYAINHSNSHDVPTSGEIIGNHSYLLASDEVRGHINGFLFELMGVSWASRTSKEARSRELSTKEHNEKLVREGQSLKTFPERTWNVSENTIIYPFKWGNVVLARDTGVPIIPIIMEYSYKDKVCYYNVGEPIYVSKDCNLVDENNYLRDTMATLRYEIWEMLSQNRPTNLTGSEYTELARSEFADYKRQIKEEYPDYDEDDEKKMIYSRTTSSQEAFKHLEKIKVSSNTAFLFGKNKSIN